MNKDIRLGNYRLVRLLGQGGFARVYLGEHVYLGTQAAIKLLHTQLGSNDEAEAFLKEAQRIGSLEHPHVIRVLDFGAQGECPYLVMDYAANGTLRQRHPRGTQVPLPTIVQYVQQIASALQYAHDHKIIHRDVKPENMLVGRHGEVLLADFGIATSTHTTNSLETQQVAGTVSYMAPEQTQGKARPASDQYALAVVVYEWLAGKPLFKGNFAELISHHLFTSPLPLSEAGASVSPDVEAVIMRALAKDPSARFTTVAEFALALESASLPISPLISQDPSSHQPQQQQGKGSEEGYNEVEIWPSRIDITIDEEQPSQPISIGQMQTDNASDYLEVKGDGNVPNQGGPVGISPSPPSNQTGVFSSTDLPLETLKDFFISYNQADRDQARWIAFSLQQAGYSVLLPPIDFREGFIFSKEMQKTLKKAKRMVVVLSLNYLRALQARTTGVKAFKRAMLDKQERLLTVCVHTHEQVCVEISGMANYIDITEESYLMAQAMLLAYVRGEGIDLPINSPPQNNPIPFPTYELFSSSLSATSGRAEVLQQVKVSFARKDWPDVARKVDFLIKQYPDTVTSEIYRMHGLALVELNNHQRAYEALSAALTLASEQERLTLLEDCVRVLTVLDRWNEILEYTKEALHLAPETSFWSTAHQQAISRLTRSEQGPELAEISSQTMLSLPKGVELFFSYSHKDEEMRQELEKHLSNLKRQRMITGWHDGEIRAGDVWEEEIEAHLSSANIILLLISPDFLDSNYCYEKEMTRAMERHKAGEAKVIPVIVRPAHWERTPFGMLQALPSGARPIVLWQNRDEAWVSVTRGIQKIVDSLTKNYSPSREGSSLAS